MKSLKQLYLEYVAPKSIPSFKAWFKNSVVVDDHGDPLVVYHGTASDFSEFEVGRTRGLFFAKDLDGAHRFASGDLKRGDSSSIMPVYLSMQKPFIMRETRDDEMVKAYYTKYFEDRPWISKKSKTAILKRGADEFGDHEVFMFGIVTETGKEILQRYGYDGIISPSANGGTTYIVFSSKQVKSATGNSGQYRGDSGDITK